MGSGIYFGDKTNVTYPAFGPLRPPLFIVMPGTLTGVLYEYFH